MLEDWAEVVKIIEKKLEDLLFKIQFQYTLNKNKNIKATLNISLLSSDEPDAGIIYGTYEVV